MPLFDRYVAVDWSANNQPKAGKDSIWSCVCRSTTAEPLTANHRTRRSAEAWLVEELTAAVRAGKRILVGLDFPYGYPAGFAAALGLEGEPWRAVWVYLAGQICDDARNISNRFEVAADTNRRLGRAAPFWGRPQHRLFPGLPFQKDVTYSVPGRRDGLPEWRHVEQRLRSTKLWPQPAWKLAGAGAVGSQALVGLPVVHRLRWHEMLVGFSQVWPFEVVVPDLPVGTPAVVHAEIWPSIVPFAHEPGSCPDERQVRAVTQHWRRLDGDNRLAELFAQVPNERSVLREEGWVLGVRSTGPACCGRRASDRSGSDVPARPRRRAR